MAIRTAKDANKAPDTPNTAAGRLATAPATPQSGDEALRLLTSGTAGVAMEPSLLALGGDVRLSTCYWRRS